MQSDQIEAIFFAYERRQRLAMQKSELNPDSFLSTIKSINLRIRMSNAGQRVELFHWNSGQLAQTGMILNNQVIAAALGLMKFLSSKYSLLLCYNSPPSQFFFPAKYSTVYNFKQHYALEAMNFPVHCLRYRSGWEILLWNRPYYMYIALESSQHQKAKNHRIYRS